MLPTLIVYSHLRWDFVYQRPQHVISRLAAKMPVIFVEEPIHRDGEPHLEIANPAPRLEVVKPVTPSQASGYAPEQISLSEPMIRRLLQERHLSEHVAWLYTPLALPLAKACQPRMVVYDCMDQLSAFLYAPPELVQAERDLLQEAAVVFTGGKSLYRDKKNHHPNVHCFPSSVDAAHFAKAKDPAIEAEDQRALPRPRLGFFGVIDERFDLRLLDELAQSRPDWQIVMIGPVVKIDPATLPRRPNIHYLGARSYEQLPSYLAGWDVALLPFAMNEATRFISPTKTLEYMAAGKMIVSAPIVDVVDSYRDTVLIGETPGRFIAACEQALTMAPAERNQRVRKMEAILAKTSWDHTAQTMHELMRSAYEAQSQRSIRKLPGRESSLASAEAEKEAAAVSQPSTKSAAGSVVVIGAGPTGLSAAYHLGEQALLLERNDRVGGWCRSIEVNGFTFDFAGHIMFSNEPYVHELYKLLLGDNVHWQDREAWIFSKNVYTRYPFQGSLYGLPPEVISECIMGAIEARYGKLSEAGQPAAAQCQSDASIKDCCADGVLESTARLARSNGNGRAKGSTKPPENFEEFIYRVWGAGIAKHFANPYNRKLWAVPLREMETSWLGGRVPLPDLREMIEGALRPMPKPMGPNARFGYPLRGGFQALMNGFLPQVRDQLRLNTGVAAVSPRLRMLTLSDGSRMPYEFVISTMPLPVLIRIMGRETPARIQQAAAALRHVSVRCVHLGIGRPNLTEKHWIYYPEETVFHRIFVQGNASPYCNPPGGFGLTCEITYSPHKPLPCEGEDLVRRCIEDCHKVGFFRPEDPVWAAAQVDLPYAYVVYDHARAENVRLIRNWLLEQDIFLAGRYSEWEYYNSDHAFVAGKKAADAVLEAREKRLTVEVGK